ncbi:hypothetical protein D3C73_1524550 [compost metagenome]
MPFLTVLVSIMRTLHNIRRKKWDSIFIFTAVTFTIAEDRASHFAAQMMFTFLIIPFIILAMQMME